jgi:two-component system response regulator AlgR
VQAIGYVLKPVRKQQLFNALERARQLSQSQLSKIVEPTTVKTHLSVKTNTGLEVIALADISHFMADQKYVTAFAGMRELILGQSLKQLEDEFGHGFIRIHRNCLVAIRAIDGLARNKAGQSHIKLKNNGQLLVISRRHLAAVKKFISSL